MYKRTKKDIKTSVVDLIFKSINFYPDKPAICYDGKIITYSDFMVGISSFADELKKSAINSPVCIFGDPSPNFVAVIIAAWCVGRPYVPISLLESDAAIKRKIENSRSDVVYCCMAAKNRLIDALAESGLDVSIKTFDTDDAPGSASMECQYERDQNAIAYILYTSGSTGTPKGIVMPHRALSNLIDWKIDNLMHKGVSIDWKSASKFTGILFSDITFDVSLLEIFVPLSIGGRLIIPTRGERNDLSRFLTLICRENVSSVYLPNVALNSLIEIALEKKIYPKNILEVSTGGEQLLISDNIRRWFSRMNNCTLQNIYGPTECHVVTAHELKGFPEDWPDICPIGKPINNVDLLLSPVDEDKNGIGEVLISGDCVSLGYINNPELTERSFSLDSSGRQIYWTGDLAKYDKDGNLVYLGRKDRKTKINGVLVDPDVIELTLASHSKVLACSIAAKCDELGNQSLIAYIVLNNAGVESLGRDHSSLEEDNQENLVIYAVRGASEWSDFLRDKYIAEEIPSGFVILRYFPLSISGKIDKNRLPFPRFQRPELKVNFIAPRNEIEEKIASIWRAMLGICKIGIDDPYFDLGGTSLSLFKIRFQVERALNCHLEVVDFFDAPTIRQLAQRIDQNCHAPVITKTQFPSYPNRSERIKLLKIQKNNKS